MIACDLIAAFMALLWLKPLAHRVVTEFGTDDVSARACSY